MKILMIGSDQVWSLERIYYKYFVEAGVDVIVYPVQNYFYTWYNRSVLNKIIYRLGLSGILKEINRALCSKVEEADPEAVLVFKGMEVLPATLKWMKSRNIFLANYNPDNPFIFSGAGSGNENVTRSIPLYDLHFTYNLEIQRQLDALGCRTALLPFGYDIADSLYEACGQQEEIVKACFLGNPDQDRAMFIEGLAQAGVEIDVYGHSWEKFVKHPGITVFPPVYGDDFWKVLRRYRVQLNLMRKHNEDSHNMRSFEIPGVGGIMLAPDTREHRLFFEDGKEVFLFTGAADCADQVRRLLNLSPESAKEIRMAARARSLKGGYSYKDRAGSALDQIRSMKFSGSLTNGSL